MPKVADEVGASGHSISGNKPGAIPFIKIADRVEVTVDLKVKRTVGLLWFSSNTIVGDTASLLRLALAGSVPSDHASLRKWPRHLAEAY
jgi:hypothetical protein